MRLLKFKFLQFLSLALVCVSPALAQNVPAPQLNLSGNIGTIGFPVLNSGTYTIPTDADLTLSGSSVNTSCVSCKITSTVALTATRKVVYPAGRFFLNVENATTGGQSITISGPTGPGVTVPNGQAVSMWNDGAGFVQIGGIGGDSIAKGTDVPVSACSTTVNTNALYLNTSTNHFYLCNGTAWLDLSAVLSITSLSTTGNISTSSLFAQIIGSSEYRADSFPSSCTVSGVSYTSKLDCALATAASVANSSWNPVVKLGTGTYTMNKPFAEPLISGGGISIVGNGMGNSVINVATLNAGSPWSAAISRGQSTGSWGQFTLKDFTLNCAPSGTINALYGLNLTQIRGDGMILQNLAINNCGDKALGGEDILIGGTSNGDPVGFHILNVDTDYHENIYAPVGQTGTYHPPATGIEFGNGSGDSIVENMIVRNASVCPVLVDATGTGDIVMKHVHPFGFGVFGTGSVYQNYASAYSFCDYSMTFNGAHDHYIEPMMDSPTTAGFDLGTNSVLIDNPMLFLPTGPTWTTSLLKLEPITAGTWEQIYVANPVCFNAPFYNNAVNVPVVINNSTNPISQPILSGGFGCAGQSDSAVSGGYEVPTTLHLNYNPGSAVTPTLDIGTHAFGNAFINFAFGRMFAGLQNYAGPMIGPNFQVCSVLGTSAASTLCYGAVNTTYFHFGSNSNSPINFPNFSLDNLGFTGSIYSTLATASTIAPTAAVVEVTGTGTISTITPPTGTCTTNSISCDLKLIAISGFSLATGGNISTAINVPAGQYVMLVYQPNTSLWSILAGSAGATYPATAGVPVYNGSNTWGTSLAVPASPLVGLSDTQILTNKTLDGVLPATFSFLDATSSIQNQLNSKASATGGNTYTSANTLTGLPSGCVQLPCSVATASLSAQTATIGTTTLYTPATAGTYRISVAIYISAVGTAGTISNTIGVNNGVGGSSNFYGPSALSTTTLGAMSQTTITAHVGANSPITYNTSFTSVTGSPAYGLDVVVTRLQ